MKSGCDIIQKRLPSRYVMEDRMGRAAVEFGKRWSQGVAKWFPGLSYTLAALLAALFTFVLISHSSGSTEGLGLVVGLVSVLVGILVFLGWWVKRWGAKRVESYFETVRLIATLSPKGVSFSDLQSEATETFAWETLKSFESNVQTSRAVNANGAMIVHVSNRFRFSSPDGTRTILRPEYREKGKALSEALLFMSAYAPRTAKLDNRTPASIQAELGGGASALFGRQDSVL